MHIRLAVISIRTLLGGAAVACALSAGNVAAKNQNVTVAVHVSTQGLDLSRPADARTFYTRLQNAARKVCTRASPVDLAPVDDLKGCTEEALAGAIRSAKIPTLTQIYLETHTPLEAARHGIELHTQVAATDGVSVRCEPISAGAYQHVPIAP